MERLTFDGNFCDIAMCSEVPGGSFCEDGYCSQRKVWERLKEYEDAEEQGRLFIAPVAVGQEMWTIGKDETTYSETDGRYILSSEVIMVSQDAFCVGGADGVSWIPGREIGHDWFLKKEDAVQELELRRRAVERATKIKPI